MVPEVSLLVLARRVVGTAHTYIYKLVYWFPGFSSTLCMGYSQIERIGELQRVTLVATPLISICFAVFGAEEGLLLLFFSKYMYCEILVMRKVLENPGN